MTPFNFLPANKPLFSDWLAQQKSPTVVRRDFIQSDQNNFPEALRSFSGAAGVYHRFGQKTGRRIAS